MSARPEPRRSFFAELQRRHVYKVGAMYCVAGWLLVQVVTQVLPVFDVSALGQRILVLIVAAGFPVALVLAWLFDITPQGIVRTPEAAGETATATRQRHGVDRKLNYLLGALLVLALGYFVLERTVLREHGGAAASDKSIAVLPFENLSDDKANAYFASGIQDEILTRLARIGALKVISRTSTAHYASSPGNLPQIARDLGVANILEGSVQKSGDAVHVNVQLIRAASDDHLWAESYNRKLDDVFSVEGEVAQTVAEALNARLSGAEQQAIAARPTDNPAAYEAYARGRAIHAGGYDMPSRLRALAAYEEAARLDPHFALAHARLAIIGSYIYFNGVDAGHVTPTLLRQAADTALKLQPDLGEALLARGFYRYRVLRDFPGALQDFQAAQQRLPNDAGVLGAMAALERRLGRWDDAVTHARTAVALDPRNMMILLSNAIELFGYLRRFDEARQMLDRASDVEPDSPSVFSARATIEQFDGRLDAAAAWVARLPRHYSASDFFIDAPLTQLRWERHWDRAAAFAQDALPPGDGPLPLDHTPWVGFLLGEALQRGGHDPEARAAFSRVVRSIKPAPDSEVLIDEARSLENLALAYAGLGDKRAALDAAAQAVDAYRDDAVSRADAELFQAIVQTQIGEHEAAIAALPHLLQIPAGLTLGQLRYDPLFDPIRDDPRVQKLLNNTPASAAGKP